ncbi:MAG: hypothetical protein LBH25_15355, partial [Fibromonadaceae bacterium]|nr:hypothetical protein [Fibromonadaceae bacterium]
MFKIKLLDYKNSKETMIMHFISLILLAIASCYATKTVKANDIIKKLEKGESIEIADAVVEGVLDFS